MKIEYKTGPVASWGTIVESTPASVGSYAWTIPDAPTTQARVRVSDALDGIPSDTSDGLVSITVARIVTSRSTVSFGTTGVGRTRTDTIVISNSAT